MKKYLWLLVLGMLPFFAEAQQMTDDERADAEKDGEIVLEDGESEVPSLLYRVSREDAQPFYLFGTIHLIGEEDFDFPNHYKEILAECEKLVLELDMDDPELQTTFMSHLTAKEGETLDKLLSKADYEKASIFFAEKVEMDLKLFNGLKPFYLNNLLYPAMINEGVSYEVYLTNLAKEMGKEVEGLETVKDQIGFMDDISAKEQAKMFMDVVNDFEKSKEAFAGMVKFYKDKNPEVLYEYMVNNMESYKKYKENLLDARNENWVRKFNSFAEEGSCFFAVGAGHLGGEMGLLNLLKHEGYKLEAIE